MKCIWAVGVMLLSTSLPASAQSLSKPVGLAEAGSGYLLLTIQRVASQDSANTNSQGANGIAPIKQTQKYKILLDSEFLSQFKNQPSATRMGTLFYCKLADRPAPGGALMMFTQWFAPKANGKLATWFWGEGAETVNGAIVDAHNGKAQVNLTFPSWATLDSSEMITLGNSSTTAIYSVNISIAAKYVPADDPILKEALLAPVFGGDKRTALVTGDPQKGLTLTSGCGFQNN